MPIYKLNPHSLQSRRGRYNMVEMVNMNPVKWAPKPLNSQYERHAAVMDEILYARQGILGQHKYWADEPLTWILTYERFYAELFSLQWLNNNDDRHNLVVSAECCLTLVQYHNHRLIAYSRSTDMHNGYFSDRLILEYLAQHISKLRPDCTVTSIEWYLAIPHVYEKPGIARLLERTKEQ